MIEDVYIASKSEEYLQTAKRLRAFVEVPQGKFIWPVKEEEFFITMQEDGWNLESVQWYNQRENSIKGQALSTCKTKEKDDKE